MLTILLGAAGSGKTLHICRDIREKMASRRGMVLLTPEQQSHRAERRLAAFCGPALNLCGEVLSFTRMAHRTAAELGGLADPLPDRSGRLLLMALALDTVAEKLQRGGGRRLDDLRQLLVTAEETRSSLTSPDMLLAAAEQAPGSLGDKLRDLGLVLEAYDAVTERQLGDRRDAVSRLAASVGESSVGLGGVWADGFTDFTAAELEVLEALLRRGTDLTVALTLPEGEEDACAVTESCFRSLLDLASRRGTEARVLRLPDPPRDEIRYLASELYHYEAPAYRTRRHQVELCRMDSFAGECRWAAARIRELMAGDGSLRYGDFALAAPNFRARRGTLEAALREYGIPAFVEEAEELGKTGLAVFLLEAVRTVTGSWQGGDLIRCLRTGFGGLSPEETDELENYCLTWNLRGEKTWREEEPWDLSPGGFGASREEDGETLGRLNALRQRVAVPFGRLGDGLREANTLRESLTALAAFLEETGVRETLTARRDRLAETGDAAGAAACLRLWGALGECLEQMDAVLGETSLPPEEFLRLLELLLESREVGAIPSALDAVSLGSPNRLRGMKPRVLLVLGADDESLPELGPEAGFFSSEEKRVLLDLGIRLGAGEEELTRPLLALCTLAASPRERLLLSWSGGEDSRPSLLILRAMALLSPPLETEAALQGRHLAAAEKPALSLALREGPWAEAVRARLPAGTAEALRLRAAGSRGSLKPETARRLYGRELRLTPSRAETFHQCACLYFLQYGLKARERKTAEFAAPESGTFIHYVLENVCRAVRDAGGFAAVSEEALRRLTAQVTERFAAESFRPRQLRDKRFLYLFRRLCRTAEAIVLDVAGELAAGDFVPLDFELRFDDREGDLPPLRLEEITVQGTVDRVDGWVDGDKLYLCVADYKTGKKQFSLTDVRYGLGIQMLVYLFLLSAEGKERYGKEIVPAGVLYAPAREVLLSMPRSADDGEIQKKRADTLRRSGLLLSDRRFLQAREHGEDPRYLPVKYRGGVPTGSIATAAQLGDLAVYVRKLLEKMGEAIRRGSAEVSPLFKSKTDGPCRWCPYGAVCGFDPRQERPRMECAVKPPEFWQALREEADHG